MADNLI